MGWPVGVKCHRSWETSYVMRCSEIGELSLARLRRGGSQQVILSHEGIGSLDVVGHRIVRIAVYLHRPWLLLAASSVMVSAS